MRDEIVVPIFCLADDFCKDFDLIWKKHLLESAKGYAGKKRSAGLCNSEIMTICIPFHLSKIRTFKDYYNGLVLGTLRKYFPKAPS